MCRVVIKRLSVVGKKNSTESGIQHFYSDSRQPNFDQFVCNGQVADGATDDGGEELRREDAPLRHGGARGGLQLLGLVAWDGWLVSRQRTVRCNSPQCYYLAETTTLVQTKNELGNSSRLGRKLAEIPQAPWGQFDKVCVGTKTVGSGFTGVY